MSRLMIVLLVGTCEHLMQRRHAEAGRQANSAVIIHRP